jgi:hypothetical protein
MTEQQAFQSLCPQSIEQAMHLPLHHHWQNLGMRHQKTEIISSPGKTEKN